MISKATIARVQEESRVEEVIGEFLSLKKRGANWMANCPFHQEKTPSFTISPAKNLYKCFGCGKAGGPVTFIMDYQQLSFAEAIRYLAKKYNIPVEEIYVEKSKEEEEAQSRLESILIANGFAQQFYQELLYSPEGSVGLSYLQERGFSKAIMDKFQLGYAADRYDEFSRKAQQSGYLLSVLQEARLVTEKEGRVFDFFRNRVMFPVHNLVGKVVGFGGRVLIKDDKSPKYLNTPESEAYQKSKLLYGIYFAKGAIRKLDECILVEGYTDVISLHQAGIEHVVASSGTAFTEEQARLIRRHTTNVTIIYDGDEAGIKAARRGSDILLEQGLHVRVVLLPPDEDPDSFVRKTGCDGFLDYLSKHKQDFILFKTSTSVPESQSDPILKVNLVREIVQTIAKIPDNIQRSIYIKECAQLMQIEEQVMIVEVNKARMNRNRKIEEQSGVLPQPQESRLSDVQLPPEWHAQQMAAVTDNLEVIERDIVRLLLEFGDRKLYLGNEEYVSLFSFVMDELEGIELGTKSFAPLLTLMLSSFSEGIIYPSSYYLSYTANPEIQRIASNVLLDKHNLSPNWWDMHRVITPKREDVLEKEILSVIGRLKQRKIMELLDEMDQRIAQAEDEQTLLSLLEKKKDLLKKRKLLFQQLGTVIYRPGKS